jgi:GT2 family glycosyltransferase
MKNHISVIIINYNTPEDTSETVKSLDKIIKKGFDYNIVVVDNGSKEELKMKDSWAKKYKQLDLLISEANLGFSGGNNLGIKHALDKYDSDFYLLLNSDTIVDKNFLLELYQLMRKDPKIGLAASKIYFHKGYEYWKDSYDKKDLHKIIWYAGGRMDWDNLLAFHAGVDEIDRGQFEKEKETDFATGCAVMISREVIERVGLLDDNFFLYLEDVEFSLRVREAGLKVMYCPKSIVWHKISKSTGGAGSPLQVYYQTRNRLYISFKHGSFRNKLTASRLAFNFLLKGNATEKKAVKDFLLGNMGKQNFI